MEKEKIARINYLANASKERELTPLEKSEQKALRDEYIAEFRKSFGMELKSTVVQYPDGTRKTLEELTKEGKKK